VGSRVLDSRRRARGYVVASEQLGGCRLRSTSGSAALPLVALTGWQLIDEAVKPRAGDVVLVTGALGSVGRAAVYAAVARGAKVLAGVRRQRKPDARKLDVVDTIALDDDGDVGRMPRLDAIANAMTPGPALQRILDKVKPGGTIGSVTGEPAGAKERGLVVRAHVVHPDPGKLAELARAAADGSLVIPIAMRVPLAQIREAHSMAEKGAEGKVVLRMQ
jgi:NADPH:quinone reductase-like Zn-dependent oxidoreductase